MQRWQPEALYFHEIGPIPPAEPENGLKADDFKATQGNVYLEILLLV